MRKISATINFLCTFLIRAIGQQAYPKQNPCKLERVEDGKAGIDLLDGGFLRVNSAITEMSLSTMSRETSEWR